MLTTLSRTAAVWSKGYKRFYSRHKSLHTPHVNIEFPDATLKYIELQSNSDRVLYTNLPEVRHLQPYLSGTRPKRVLEIGGGVGRASVYFARRFGWKDTVFHMLDGNSGDRQVAPINGSRLDRFYNSADATLAFCNANGLQADRVVNHNAESNDWQLDLSGIEFDFIYSFAAFGFHWSIHYYLPDLRPLCHRNTMLIFGMRGTDRGNDFAERQVRELDATQWRILLNARDSELDRSSVLVIQPWSMS